MEQILLFFGSLLIGGLLGWLAYKDATRRADSNFKQKEKEAEAFMQRTKDEAEQIVKRARDEESTMMEKLKDDHKRMIMKEESLNTKEKVVDDKLDLIDKKRENLDQIRLELDKQKVDLATADLKVSEQLAKVAKISREEAKDELFAGVEKEFATDLAKIAKRTIAVKKQEAKDIANEYIVTAIQKYASDIAKEATATIVEIPSDDFKGKIIGREGRNISVFEILTGVDVIIDDTPNGIIISGFDLMRRHIARVAMEKLIGDGRINPARIEEVVKKVAEDTNEMIRKMGEKAVNDLGITAFVPPEMYKIIGRLYFRTSYGQNILKHSKEVAYIASTLAGEMGLDTKIALTAAFLHDIGKAVTHEIEGSHAVIGAQILRRFKMKEEIINPVESHHEDVEANSLLAHIVAAADAISAARPGARSDSMENYIQRLQELENLATSYSGVDKAYAISAGREVRIFVQPKEISDLQASRLSKDIALDIQSNMSYPGEIKVNVIREQRYDEYAR